MVNPNVSALARLNNRLVSCRRCQRLVDWREQVATEKRASFANEVYWGKPVPFFGDPGARLVVVGLAPAAHGGNRTGRMFTGDRSGDWLYASMHRTGFANQPTSVDANDGLVLKNAWVTATVKCAPPANKPTLEERNTCMSDYLERELELLVNKSVIVCLGKFAYDAVASLMSIRPKPPFGHGVEMQSPDGLTIICSFHPSQQNTFTGKLTEPMLDSVFTRAHQLTSGSD